MPYACACCGKVFEPTGSTVGLYCSRCEPSTQDEQEQADKLIEAIGPEIKVLIDDLVQHSEAIVSKHWASLFQEPQDPKVRNFVLGGMLIGPAMTFTIAAGATEEGMIAIVRRLFADARAETEEKPAQKPGSN